MSAEKVLREVEEKFLQLHKKKEDLFWQVKMDLADDREKARKEFAQAEIEMNRFLQDPQNLRKLLELRSHNLDEKERLILEGWIAVFQANSIEDPKARELSEEIVHLEQELAAKRTEMKLGWTDPKTGEFHPASSVKLSLMMRTHPEEGVREAAYRGLLSIEEFVLQAGFLEIVKKRNQLGRMLGYSDFYAWRVAVVERLKKEEIFFHLQNLADGIGEKAERELKKFAQQKGDGALKPWNFLYLRTGKLIEELDPYFPFSEAIWNWGRSFNALNIKFREATLTLDLLDRPGKYENGFMHGPEPAYWDRDGHWHPARINFSANAIPGQQGSGLRALQTLFHEGGHAAHFSNIQMPSPCFSHEFAPTSIAYAETQSMFLDSILQDADWRARYAKTKSGEPMPKELIEKAIENRQPFKAWDQLAMLTIPFAERELYETPDDKLQPEYILNRFREIERDLQKLEAGVRPILSVPHLLAGESSAYYHGYLLAEMAVYQTREFFLKRDGHLVDNPKIGPDLSEYYWKPGNSANFFDTVKKLTGREFSAQSLIEECNLSTETALQIARNQLEQLQDIPQKTGPINLNAKIKIIHGKQLIGSTEDEPFEKVAEKFSKWISELEEKNLKSPSQQNN